MSNPFDDLKADDEGGAGEEEENVNANSPETTESSDPESGSTASSDSSDSGETVSASPSPSPSSASTSQSSRSDTDSMSDSAPEPDRDPEAETEPEPSGESDTADPADIGPAFEYSDVKQRPLYARAETWNNLEDELGITVTPELRRKGIRDEETREIHDAILKVAIEHIDEIPEIVAEERRRSD